VLRTRDCAAAHAVLIEASFAATLLANNTIEMQHEDALARPDAIATRLVQAGHAPTMLTIEEEDLEHYFLRLVGRAEAGREAAQTR